MKLEYIEHTVDRDETVWLTVRKARRRWWWPWVRYWVTLQSFRGKGRWDKPLWFDAEEGLPWDDEMQTRLDGLHAAAVARDKHLEGLLEDVRREQVRRVK